MSDDKNISAQIHRPASALEVIGPGSKGILTRMVSETLATAKSQEKALAAASRSLNLLMA